jgi:hypothetical protein
MCQIAQPQTFNSLRKSICGTPFNATDPAAEAALEALCNDSCQVESTLSAIQNSSFAGTDFIKMTFKPFLSKMMAAP